jgi:four helix bundle protein
MSQRGLEQFGAYQKALELFDLVVGDMQALKADHRCYKLISQQVASADSICANIEEGYGRLSRVEYVRFLGRRVPRKPRLGGGVKGYN